MPFGTGRPFLTNRLISRLWVIQQGRETCLDPHFTRYAFRRLPRLGRKQLRNSRPLRWNNCGSASTKNSGHLSGHRRVGLRVKTLFAWALLSLMGAAAWADDPPPAYYEPARFFRTQILPILESRCFECHSQAEGVDDGGLVLDTKAGWTRGGDHGPAVVPNNLKESPLIQTVRSHDSNNRMPPDERLPAIEIALLETWVLLGAPDPRPK